MVRQLVERYCQENHCSSWDINNGLCADFAADLIAACGGQEDEQLHELAGDMFFNVRDEDFARANWGQTTTTDYGIWSDEMLQHWGAPPGVDLTNVNNELNHVWVYCNGRHYDSECQHGVDRWFKLPFFERFFSQFYNHSQKLNSHYWTGRLNFRD